MHRNRIQRGFSLLETLVASAVLIIGLTGTTAMLTRGAVNGRNGQQMMDSAHLANQVLADLAATGPNSMVPTSGSPSFDAGTAQSGGTWVDPSGRQYSIAYIISDISAPSPPAPLYVPTYQIQVEVGYLDGSGQRSYVRAQTTLSQVPDAGP
jgi:prepilin-type N-terminal cleavage/methylation domain-containing protein